MNDVKKDIKESTNLDYLTELYNYLEEDINSINKTSDKIKKIQADMRGISVEEMEKLQLKEIKNLKMIIEERISELK